MAAVQDGDPVAPRTDTQRRTWPQWLVFLTTAAGYALTLLVFHPGYSTLDARYVYDDAQAWHFGDWQSPVMGVLWRLIDPLAPGALSMFLLIATLYWLGFGLLALTVRAARALARPGDAAARTRAAGVLLRRHDLARHPVRRRLAGRRGAAVRGGRTRARRVRAADADRRSLLLWSRSASCCGRTRSSRRRFSPPMCSGPRASTSSARRIVVPARCRPVCYALVPAVYYGLLDAKRSIRCIRSWCSISAASRTSPARTSFR